MIGKKLFPDGGKVDTVIGNGSSFNGNLKVEGTLRVDGKVDGEITVDGDIIIGKSGFVQGSINGHNATVAGDVHGNFKLNGKLELSNTGKVIGDIEVDKLIISEGAVFQGRSSMNGNDKNYGPNRDFKKPDDKIDG